MLTITEISPQKKKGRVNLFIDGEFFCGLFKETALRGNLKIGQKISQKELEKILEEDQYIKALETSQRFLSFRPRSEKEVENKLKEKGFHPQIIKKTLKHLKKIQLLDDKKFVEIWLADREALKPQGAYKLKRELKNKGISEELVEKVFQNLKDSQKEFNLALKAIEKKIGLYKNLPFLEKKKKIEAFLLRRGFSFKTIKKVLDKVNFFNDNIIETKDI